MSIATRSLLAALALTAAMPLHAAGDAAAGKAKSSLCAACHGANGIAAIDTYPNLAGQNEKYLVDAINQYRNGGRNNPMMKPMVASLSDDDVANLAAYFASQPGKQ